MEFVSGKEKSIVFLYWVFILYIQCSFGKVWKKDYCNNIQLFWKVTSRDNMNWCGGTTGIR